MIIFRATWKRTFSAVGHCDLPWYKGVGIISYVDELKNKSFIENPKNKFYRTTIVNFDIIHTVFRGDLMQCEVKGHHQIRDSDFENYSHIVKTQTVRGTNSFVDDIKKVLEEIISCDLFL